MANLEVSSFPLCNVGVWFLLLKNGGTYFSSFGVLGSRGCGVGKAESVLALASRPRFYPVVQCRDPLVGKPWPATLTLGIQKRLRLASQLIPSRAWPGWAELPVATSKW